MAKLIHYHRFESNFHFEAFFNKLLQVDFTKFTIRISMNSNLKSLSFKFSLKASFCQKQFAPKSYFNLVLFAKISWIKYRETNSSEFDCKFWDRRIWIVGKSQNWRIHFFFLSHFCAGMQNRSWQSFYLPIASFRNVFCMFSSPNKNAV